MKIAVVTNIVPPYRAALFNEIGRAAELTVLVSARREKGREWRAPENEARRFRMEVLPGVHWNVRDRTVHVSAGLGGALERIDPDVVVGSSFNPNCLAALAFARARGKRALLWSEATAYSERVGCLRRRFRKFLVAKADAVIASGADAREYLLGLGAAPERCFVAVNAAPPPAAQLLPAIRERAAGVRFGLPGFVLLYAGRFVPEKGIAVLLHAYRELRSAVPATLVMMGAGPMEREVRQYREKHRLADLRVVGFQDEVSKWIYYHAADALVLPAEGEVWGMVINEALIAGLPVLSSRFAGAARDLVSDGVTGFVIDPMTPPHLAATLARMAADPRSLTGLRANARERVGRYTIDNAARAFLTAAGGALL